MRVVSQSLGREEDDRLRRSVGLATGREHGSVEQRSATRQRLGQSACEVAQAGAPGLDARPRQAAEARRPLRRVGRPRSPGAVVSASELCSLPPVQRGRHRHDCAGLRVAAGADEDRRRPTDPGDIQHRRSQDHRARRSRELGAVLPDVEAWRRADAAGRLERGRRARHADDPRLDRPDAARESRGRPVQGSPRLQPKIETRSSHLRAGRSAFAG